MAMANIPTYSEPSCGGVIKTITLIIIRIHLSLIAVAVTNAPRSRHSSIAAVDPGEKPSVPGLGRMMRCQHVTIAMQSTLVWAMMQ